MTHPVGYLLVLTAIVGWAVLWWFIAWRVGE